MRRFATRQRRWKTGAQHASGISLTSLMDILVCLLFFVLQSFVAGGEATVPPPGLELPSSSAESPMVTSLVIAIDGETILLGSERIASVPAARASREMIIGPLAARLREVRDQMDDLDRRKGVDKASPRIVTIQGDQDVEFKILQKVMYTLNQEGFPDIALAVTKKGEDA